MSLTINDLESIAKNIANSKWIESSRFEILKKKVLEILEINKVKFVYWEKKINSLHQLSTNFCQYINKDIESPLIKELEFDFKKEVALILKAENIEELWSLLSKINNLESWNPTLLMAIWRKSKRENDVMNKYQDLYNDDEKKKILSIYQWIKTNIRSEDWKKIDWYSVIKKLNEEWYEKLANKFTTQN